jgi:hypothetical protein
MLIETAWIAALVRLSVRPNLAVGGSWRRVPGFRPK